MASRPCRCRAWAWKTASRTLKYLSLAGAAGEQEAGAASSPASVRNSRNTYRTWPVSTYLALKAGKTSLLKWAQWVQLAEPYSITVTGAFGRAHAHVGLDAAGGGVRPAGRRIRPSAGRSCDQHGGGGSNRAWSSGRGAGPRGRGGASASSTAHPRRGRRSAASAASRPASRGRALRRRAGPPWPAAAAARGRLDEALHDAQPLDRAGAEKEVHPRQDVRAPGAGSGRRPARRPSAPAPRRRRCAGG